MSENKRVALQFVEAMSKGDPALAAPCLAPEAFTLTRGHGKFAGRRDADVMVGMIGSFERLLPTGLNLTVVNVVDGGDQIVVEARGDGATAAGIPYRNEYCFVFTMAAGKITQVSEYFCTLHADTVLWPVVEQLQAGGGA